MRTLRQQQALALREANQRHDRALAARTQARTQAMIQTRPPTTPPAMTPPATDLHADARTRSLALAAARGETSCSWSAHTRDWTLDPTTGALRTLALEIDSATRADVRYALTYDAAADDAQCCCRAAQASRACWHRGLAILKGRSVAACCTPAGRASAAREAKAEQIAEANEEALAPSL